MKKYKHDKINYFTKTKKFQWYTTEQDTAQQTTVKQNKFKNVYVPEPLCAVKMSTTAKFSLDNPYYSW
jgi:hypothetical protein